MSLPVTREPRASLLRRRCNILLEFPHQIGIPKEISIRISSQIKVGISLDASSEVISVQRMWETI